MIFGQVTQQVFVVEEWYCDTRKWVDAEALTRADIEKLLGDAKQSNLNSSRNLKW